MNKHLFPIIIIITVIGVSIFFFFTRSRKNNLFKTSSTQLDLPLIPRPRDIPYDPHTDYKIFFIGQGIPIFQYYWMFHPIKDNKFTIEIYDLDLNKIKTVYDTTILEQKTNSIIFTGIINNDKFTGRMFGNTLWLYLPTVSIYGYTIPKMVKPIDTKELTDTGAKINLYGFSNTQKIELECMGIMKEEYYNYWSYNAKLYDNDKVIKTGSGKLRLVQNEKIMWIGFDDNVYLRGIITPVESDKTIGIVLEQELNFDSVVYYFGK